MKSCDAPTLNLIIDRGWKEFLENEQDELMRTGETMQLEPGGTVVIHLLTGIVRVGIYKLKEQTTLEKYCQK